MSKYWIIFLALIGQRWDAAVLHSISALQRYEQLVGQKKKKKNLSSDPEARFLSVRTLQSSAETHGQICLLAAA